MFQILGNTTSELTNSFNAMPLASIIIVSVVVAIVLGLLISARFLGDILKLLNGLSHTLQYTGIGVLTSGIVIAIYIMGKTINDMSGGGISLSLIAEYSLYAVAGYGGLTLLGYGVSKGGSRIKKNYGVIKKDTLVR